jgi:invasion protein IalB
MPSILPRSAAVALLVAISLTAGARSFGKEKAPAPPRGPAKSELAPSGAGWLKVCFEEPPTRLQTCYTTRDFAEEGGTPILSLEAFETKGEELMLIRVFLPLGLALRPGLRIGLERGDQESGAFDACFPAGCYASSKVPAALVDAMKRGGRLSIAVKKLSGQELDFLLPLDGFGKAFDGPGVSSEEISADQRKRLQDELSEAAAAERRRLEGQGVARTPAPPPVQPAPEGR